MSNRKPGKINIKQKIIRILLNVIKVCPVRKNRISFMSYTFTQYSCNPKYISEYIHEKYADEYELVWYYEDEKLAEKMPDYVKKCKKGSMAYYKNMLTSRVVITNVTFPRVIPFRRKQRLINTWHGTAFKGDKNSSGNNYNLADYFLAENKLTCRVLGRKDSFDYHGKIVTIGMPRNDMLIKSEAEKIKAIKERIGIGNEHILIYAPTFRESEINPFDIDFERLLCSLKNRFGGEWRIMFRYHHMQKNRPQIKGSIDMSAYPDMQELMLVSDILITDYSSTMWDFSLMNKPVFLYAKDLEEYIGNERGEFFFPLDRLPFKMLKSNNELNDEILNFDNVLYLNNLERYHDEMGRFNMNGDATEKFVNRFIRK